MAKQGGARGPEAGLGCGLAPNGALPLSGRGKDVPYDDPHAEAALKTMIRMTTLADRVQEAEVRESVK